MRLNRTRRSISQTSPAAISATIEVVLLIDYSVYDWMTSGPVKADGETDATVNLLLYFAHLNQMVYTGVSI